MLRGPYLFAEPGSGLNPVSQRIRRDPALQDSREITRNSLRTYIQRLRPLQRRYPDKRINELSTEDLLAFLRTDDHGQPRRLGEQGWKEGTHNAYVNAFYFAFRWAKKHALIEADPTEGIELISKPRYDRRHVWLTEAEVDQLTDLRVAGENPIAVRDVMICQFLVGTGVRAFEAAAAMWGDIETIGGDVLIHVNRGKGNKYRLVPPTRKTVEYLELWRQLATGLLGRPPLPTEYVLPPGYVLGFDGPNAVKLGRTVLLFNQEASTDTLRRSVRLAGERIAQPRLRPHDLRRTYAGLCENNGIDIRTISKNLGHSSVATTETYLADNPAKRARSVAALSF